MIASRTSYADRAMRRKEMADAVAAGEHPDRVARRFGVSRSLVFMAMRERPILAANEDARRTAIKVNPGRNGRIGPPHPHAACWRAER